MKKTIFIGKPYITHENNFVRLCSDVTRPSGKFTLYYEVPLEYEKYLCIERVNSFVLGILEYAMYMGYDIKSDTPIDEALHYQLCNYAPRIMADNLSFFIEISIDIPFTSVPVKGNGAVGTGFSAGVDSFYTVLKHLNLEESSYKLTHLLIANVGAFSYAPTEKTTEIFYKQVKALTPAAEELGLPLISVNTNYNDFYLDANVRGRYTGAIYGGSPLKIAACAYAFQKLFSVYYIASTVQLDKFKFMEDNGIALLYYVKLFSTSSLLFYGSGTEVSRIEKVKYICENSTVQKFLSVDLGKNCSRCTKCLRTMFELYSLNILDKYDKCFDIQDFKQHLSSRLGLYFSVKEDRYDNFIQETIRMCKENGIKIPVSAYLKHWLIFKPFYFVKALLRNNKFVRKLYYKFNIDMKLYRNTDWRDFFCEAETSLKR